MATMKAKYLGQLRVECEHVASGTKMMTDAPVDNCGKGEAFSPTDLCAAALGSCILTTMGIYAGQHNIYLEGTEMEITKTMGTEPRRIVRIGIDIFMPAKAYSAKDRIVLERVAQTCPVYYSLNEHLEKSVRFHWSV